ncbi:hypothetical protein DRP77_10705 [Candidatus Poribacteria bacterium]|nr:MAG: hypothetical protein DRP77_10705 [Candidatus Poribacteria bacterium]
MGGLQNRIVEELIGLIEEELALLRRKQSVSLEEYLGDVELQHVVERALQKAIQACIDIGARIISRLCLRRAESYHDIFDVLWQEGVIPLKLRDKMHEMVGLRNVLVREYRVIDPREIHRHLRESLGTLEEFASHIARFISSGQEGFEGTVIRSERREGGEKGSGGGSNA